MIKVTKQFVMAKDVQKRSIREEDDNCLNMLYLVDTGEINSEIVSAQELIDRSRKGLCDELQAQILMDAHELKDAVYQVDHTMAHAMVPECYYRGGMCPYQNPNGCTENMVFIRQMISTVPEKVYRDARNEAAPSMIIGE